MTLPSSAASFTSSAPPQPQWEPQKHPETSTEPSVSAIVLGPSPRVLAPASAPLIKLAIALLSVSFAPIFIRFSETDLSADATVFNRLVIFLCVFGLGRLLGQPRQPVTSQADAPSDAEISPSDPALSSVSPTESPINRNQWLLLLSVGVVAITSLVLWAMSLTYTTVAKSMLLNNLTPLFTSLGAWLFLSQRFERRFVLGMALALGGALYLGFGDLAAPSTIGAAEAGSEHSGQLLGDIYAVLSAVFLGAYFLLVEQLRQRFSATTILLWRCAVGSALLLPFILVQGEQLFPHTATAGLAVVGLGIVGEGMGQRLLADCMAQLSSSFVSLCLLLEPVLSGLLAWVIFGEAIGQSTWLGFAIVLAGIYLAQSSTPQVSHG